MSLSKKSLPVISHPEVNEETLRSEKGVSLVAFLDTVRKRKDGTCSIKLKIIHERFPTYYSTKVSVTEDEYQKLLGKRLTIEELLAKDDGSNTQFKNTIKDISSIQLGLDELDRLEEIGIDIKVNYKKGTEKGGEPPKKLGQVESSNSEDLWTMSDWFAEEADAVQSEIDSMNAAIAQGMAQMVSTFAEGFGQMMTGDISFTEFFNNILSQFGGFLKQFGEMLIAYGIAEQAFMKSMDPFTKIAAGVALVAIGAALTSLGSAGPGGNGSAPATSATYGSANLSSSVPSTAMSMPTSSGDNQMVLQVEMATELRSDHIALMAKKGANKINRRG